MANKVIALILLVFALLVLIAGREGTREPDPVTPIIVEPVVIEPDIQPQPEPEPTPEPTPEPEPVPAPSIDWVSETQWHKEVERTGKPAWVFFTLKTGCPWCEVIKKETLPRKEVIAASKQFVCVWIDAQNRAATWGVWQYPTSVFVRPGPGTKTKVRTGGVLYFKPPQQAAAFVDQLNKGFAAANLPPETGDTFYENNQNPLLRGDGQPAYYLRQYDSPRRSRPGRYRQRYYRTR
jgi:thioredoxin-related protein